MLYWQFLVCVAAPLWAFLLHLALARCLGRTTYSQQLVCLVACTVGILATSVAAGGGNFSHFAFALLVSTNLTHAYFHFFNMSETARRIRLLTMLLAGARPLSDLKADYPVRATLEVRLQRMVQLHLARKVGSGWAGSSALAGGLAKMIVAYEGLLFTRARSRP